MNFIERLDNTDKQLFIRINRLSSRKVLNRFMRFVTLLGSAQCTVSLAIIMLYLNYHKSNVGIAYSVSLASSHAIAHFVKRLFNRPRPWQVIQCAYIYNLNYKQYSFPSGHTTAAFSTFILLALCASSLASVFCLAAALVGISRIYLGAHYPSDVLAGSFLGTIAAYASYICLF